MQQFRFHATNDKNFTDDNKGFFPQSPPYDGRHVAGDGVHPEDQVEAAVHSLRLCVQYSGEKTVHFYVCTTRADLKLKNKKSEVLC